MININERLKDFWKDNIYSLLFVKGVNLDPLEVNGKSYQKQLEECQKWDEINQKALELCQKVYENATIAPVSSIPTTIPALLVEIGENSTQDFENIRKDTFFYWERKLIREIEKNEELERSFKVFEKIFVNRLLGEVLGYDINNEDTMKKEGFESGEIREPHFYWRHLKNNVLKRRTLFKVLKTERRTAQKIKQVLGTTDLPTDWSRQLAKKTDLDTLQDDYNVLESYHNDLLATLDYTATQNDYDPTNTWQDLKTNRLGTNTLNDIPVGKTLTDLLTSSTTCPNPFHHLNYNNVANQLTDYKDGFRQILELNATDPVPTNLNDLADLYNAKSGTQSVIQLKTKADQHDRIHTKLSGKVSDSELDALLAGSPGSPTCPHTDYDAIKTERDQLKEHKCDCDSKVAAKETEIINKIITDLSLTTERERENVLEAVITEIKKKINPPTDNSQDTKISQLESQITNLKTPASLKDIKVSAGVKEEILAISKAYGLTSEKLASVSSYQELATLQSQAFKSKLESEVSSKKTAQGLNIGLGGLCIGSLCVLAWLLYKQFGPQNLGEKAKE